SVEAQAVKLGKSTAEIRWGEFVCLVPIVSAVAGFKNAPAGQHISRIFSCEIDVIDRMRCSDRTLGPGETAVFSVAEKAVVAPHPSALPIDEVNRIQIFATGPQSPTDPATLWGRSRRRR